MANDSFDDISDYFAALNGVFDEKIDWGLSSSDPDEILPARTSEGPETHTQPPESYSKAAETSKPASKPNLSLNPQAITKAADEPRENSTEKKKSSPRDTSSVSNEDTIEEKRKKLGKSGFIKYLFPSDLRLSYTRIIVDAFNTGNFTHFKNVVKSFCSPSCILREYFYGGESPFSNGFREYIGVPEVAFYFQLYHEAIPDVVMTVQDFHTKIFETVPKNFIEYLNKVGLNNSPSTELSPTTSSEGVVFFMSCSFSGNKAFEILQDKPNLEQFVSSKDSIEFDWKLFFKTKIETRKSPLTTMMSDIKVLGYWAIVLNKSGKIDRFEFHFTNKKNI